MQVERLFQIVFILLGQEKMTAKELAKRFQVSTRTIYRDLDTLSVAGIPVYTNKGNGGGIRILPNFKLDKALISEKEQSEILLGLQCLAAVGYQEKGEALQKMEGLFQKEQNNWLEVDFTPWGTGSKMQESFAIIKEGIANNHKLSFDYYGTIGEKTSRTIAPYQLVFKGRAWYVRGFCELRKEIRLFKLTRIRELVLIEEHFTKVEESNETEEMKVQELPLHKITLHFSSQMAYRMYDEFELEQVELLEDGSFRVVIEQTDEPWLYQYLLSFGKEVKVIEPLEIREKLIRHIEEIANLYKK